MTSDSTVDPRSLRSTYATAFSLVEKIISIRIAIFYLVEKIEVKFSDTMDQIPITEEGRVSVDLPFV